MRRGSPEDALDRISGNDPGADGEAQARLVVLANANDATEGAIFLAMLGITPPEIQTDGPPDYRREGPCGRQMYRKDWPHSWRKNRAMCNSTERKCMGCRKAERKAER